MTTIGILGGGQLGRMLALAGLPLGLNFVFFDPAAEAPADAFSLRIGAPFDDLPRLDDLARLVDLVTYEFENVPVESAHYLARSRPVWPPPAALEVSQDRLAEKTFFQQLGIPTPEFRAVTTREDLDAAVQAIGLPAVLKTRRMGYDGKGQRMLRAPEDLDPAWEALGGTPLILERFVPFDCEMSVLVARSTAGETKAYPLVQNTHREGILRLSLAPAPDATPALQVRAEEYARRVLDALGYAGVLAIEWFVVNGDLLANEMAPRVHNSGHWTIEGAETSQFANHLRAIVGWPLGAPDALGYSAMVNLIGSVPPIPDMLALRGAHLHLYDKAPRPGRKLGHITLRAPDRESLQASLDLLLETTGISIG
jgi:5-(carboxyamino)imidazole ribonucleotide synthase